VVPRRSFAKRPGALVPLRHAIEYGSGGRSSFDIFDQLTNNCGIKHGRGPTMMTIRELITDERSVVAAGTAVLASLLGALAILGVYEMIDSAADIYDRASRGRLSV
jgi:hypothetical protein